MIDEEVSFDSSTIKSGCDKSTYRGIPVMKCPFDYFIYQMLVFLVKPDLIIEVGSYRGGSTLYLADLLDILGSGEIHTIDVANNCHELVNSHKKIKIFSSGWQGYDIDLAKNFNKVMVIEDASHRYYDCLLTLRKFAPIVSKDSYLVVEDGIVTELGWGDAYYGGPLRSISEFLQENRDFQIDRTYCDMFGKNATFNVNGYLKRIK
jgi:cephalosporin hydroxylase